MILMLYLPVEISRPITFSPFKRIKSFFNIIAEGDMTTVKYVGTAPPRAGPDPKFWIPGQGPE